MSTGALPHMDAVCGTFYYVVLCPYIFPGSLDDNLRHFFV